MTMKMQVRVCGEYCNELFDVEAETTANGIRQALTLTNQAQRRRSSYWKILAAFVETLNGHPVHPHLPTHLTTGEDKP